MGIIGLMAAYPLATLSIVIFIILVGIGCYLVDCKERQKERMEMRKKYPYVQYLDDSISGRDTSWYTRK